MHTHIHHTHTHIHTHTHTHTYIRMYIQTVNIIKYILYTLPLLLQHMYVRTYDIFCKFSSFFAITQHPIWESLSNPTFDSDIIEYSPPLLRYLAHVRVHTVRVWTMRTPDSPTKLQLIILSHLGQFPPTVQCSHQKKIKKGWWVIVFI